MFFWMGKGDLDRILSLYTDIVMIWTRVRWTQVSRRVHVHAKIFGKLCVHVQATVLSIALSKVHVKVHATFPRLIVTMFMSRFTVFS